MTTSMTRVRILSIGALVAIATPAFAGGIVLIGPLTKNGSFEDGIAAPWRAISVAEDPSFASDGDWYAVVPDVAKAETARGATSQIGLTPNPENGLTFVLEFDARNGTQGFDSVYSYINAWNANGTIVSPSALPITTPPLTSAGWAGYRTSFQFPETWDGGGKFVVGFQFTKAGAIIGETYTGFLDKVLLTQVPEPSGFALLGLAGLLFAGRAMRQR